MDKKTIDHVLNILRRGTIGYHVRREALTKGRVRTQVGVYKNGKPKYLYLYPCAKCNELFREHEIEMDHIDEVGSFNGNFDDYIKRMYCPLGNWQRLCVVCHKKKTAGNATLRYSRSCEVDDL